MKATPSGVDLSHYLGATATVYLDAKANDDALQKALGELAMSPVDADLKDHFKSLSSLRDWALSFKSLADLEAIDSEFATWEPKRSAVEQLLASITQAKRDLATNVNTSEPLAGAKARTFCELPLYLHV